MNGVVAAAIALFDPLKPEARGVIAALQQRGVKCHLVTGDNQRTAHAIAARLAITNVTAESLPAGKAAVVKARDCSCLTTATSDLCISTWRYARHLDTFGLCWPMYSQMQL